MPLKIDPQIAQITQICIRDNPPARPLGAGAIFRTGVMPLLAPIRHEN
jgi:hypothetical protein